MLGFMDVAALLIICCCVRESFPLCETIAVSSSGALVMLAVANDLGGDFGDA